MYMVIMNSSSFLWRFLHNCKRNHDDHDTECFAHRFLEDLFSKSWEEVVKELEEKEAVGQPGKYQRYS